MGIGGLLLTLGVLTAAAFFLSWRRAWRQGARLGGIRHLRALPIHYAWQAALWCLLPGCAILAIWNLFDERLMAMALYQRFPGLAEASVAQRSLDLNAVRNIAGGAVWGGAAPELQAAGEYLRGLRERFKSWQTLLVAAAALSGAAWGLHITAPKVAAWRSVDRALRTLLMACATLATLVTVGILMSVLFESVRFFQMVSPLEFLFGSHWSPQIALRADQVAAKGSFGVAPILLGTMLTAFVAMMVSAPVGLMSAVYLSEYAEDRTRALVKPMLEVLAGIPTVVYGVFAALTVAPLVRAAGEALGLEVSAESVLAAGLVMGLMIIPMVSSLSDDAISAVPDSLREGALGLGALRSEVVRQVVLPAALPGVMAGMLLAISRAIGETMIVVMAAGLIAKLTLNPLDSATTITVQIVTLLIGDQEFDSPKTLAAFALGLLLFLITLMLNVLALLIVRRYRERYE